MRNLIAAILMLGLLGGCMTASTIPDDPSERLTAETVIYVETAASIDRFTIEASRLALEKSQVPEVRGLATTLIGDHAALDRDLMAAMGTVRPASLAFALVSHHYAMLERLRTAGAEFDPLYRDYLVAVHTEALSLHQEYAGAGNVVALVDLARRALPISEAHLRQVEALPLPPTPAPLQPAAPPPPAPPPPPPGSLGERG